MIPVQSTKTEVLFSTAATNATNSTNYGYLDTLGWDHADIYVLFPTAATTSAVATVLSLTEGTNSTAATAVVAFTGGTATSTSVGYVIPAFKSSEATCVKFDVNLTKRQRYLRVNVTPEAAYPMNAIAILSRGKQEPSSDVGNVGKTVIG